MSLLEKLFGKIDVDDKKIKQAELMKKMGRRYDDIVRELGLNETEKKIVFQWFNNI